MSSLDRQRRKQFIDDVNKIHAQLLSAFNSKGKMADSESSLKEKIVRRKNLTQGPWFKCVKGRAACILCKASNEIAIYYVKYTVNLFKIRTVGNR